MPRRPPLLTLAAARQEREGPRTPESEWGPLSGASVHALSASACPYGSPAPARAERRERDTGEPVRLGPGVPPQLHPRGVGGKQGTGGSRGARGRAGEDTQVREGTAEAPWARRANGGRRGPCGACLRPWKRPAAPPGTPGRGHRLSSNSLPPATRPAEEAGRPHEAGPQRLGNSGCATPEAWGTRCAAGSQRRDQLWGARCSY